ncbi:hypothetical protein FDZ74_06370 [bacterium]|nr:MAG: hypothetical protein FDZ74_06370 [bacterium]
MNENKKRSPFWQILKTIAIVLVIAAVALAAVRLIGGKPLGIRHWVDVQLWHANALANALSHSREVKSFSEGDYTNVVFLHHSVGENLITQTDLRDQLTGAGLDLWDHDYNYYGLNDLNGNPAGYNYWIPDDNTDPDGLAKLFSQKVYSLPVNGISGLMQHEVIVFKSCFTGNAVLNDAQVETQKGYYETVHAFIAQHPDKLFILLTTPPLNSAEADPAMAARNRLMADWLLSEDYRRGLTNLYVFDLYGQLADNDPASPDYSTLLAEYREGSDNHPNLKANQAVAPLLADFIVETIQAYHPVSE